MILLWVNIQKLELTRKVAAESHFRVEKFAIILTMTLVNIIPVNAPLPMCAKNASQKTMVSHVATP